MAARSYQSYAKTLKNVLLSFRPERVFEWGPGESTYEIAKIAKEVISVEHDKTYYKPLGLGNVEHKLISNLDDYATEPRKYDKFNFFFVDGRNRQRCLAIARERLFQGGCVMLHDAERERYREHINKYPFQAWTDEGSTVTLTVDIDTHLKVLGALRDMLIGSVAR